MSKNIALCFDGTWNQPTDRFAVAEDDPTENPQITNVVKLKRLADPFSDGVSQVVLYFNGVGTDWYDHIRGGIAGRGLSARIKLGYEKLVNNYAPGDKIFLFGFSRGAYTARSLGGMIRKCGIMRRECLGKLDDAFALYRRRDPAPDAPDVVEFRKANSYDNPEIHFLGVWDTVGELGIPLAAFKGINEDLCGFHDTSLSKIVKHGFHAVAIDENRKTFAPTLWTNEPATGQEIEQRWFVGAHCDVGGGYAEDQLSDIALEWMVKEAAKCGLKIQPFTAGAANYGGLLHDSYSHFLGPVYRFFHPRFYRPIDLGVCGQTLDKSVVERLKCATTYHPKSLSQWGPEDIKYVREAVAAIAPDVSGDKT